MRRLLHLQDPSRRNLFPRENVVNVKDLELKPQDDESPESYPTKKCWFFQNFRFLKQKCSF